MGGIKSVVSMGYAVLFVILLYRECSNMYYFDHFNCSCFVFNPCDDP